MIDERLKVTDHVLEELRKMRDGEESVSQMIWFLYRAGVPKPGALVALRRAGVMPIGDTKLAVHTHEAYADRRAADEVFEDALVQGVDALQVAERVAAA